MYSWNTCSFCIIGAAWVWLCCELGTDLYFKAALFELMKHKLFGSLKFTTIEKPIFQKKKRKKKLLVKEINWIWIAADTGHNQGGGLSKGWHLNRCSRDKRLTNSDRWRDAVANALRNGLGEVSPHCQHSHHTCQATPGNEREGVERKTRAVQDSEVSPLLIFSLCEL